MSNNLYISNIDKSITKHLLRELLIQTSPIKDLKYPYNKIKKEYCGYCVVEYLTKEDCDYTFKILNSVILNKKELHFRKTKKNKEIKLHIKNINKDITERLLCEEFEKYGDCQIKIVKDESGSKKDFAFVIYNSYEECKLAIEKMNRKEFYGNKIEVSFAKRQGRKKRKKMIQ